MNTLNKKHLPETEHFAVGDMVIFDNRKWSIAEVRDDYLLLDINFGIPCKIAVPKKCVTKITNNR